MKLRFWSLTGGRLIDSGSLREKVPAPQTTFWPRSPLAEAE
jgi:hypothetical protein